MLMITARERPADSQVHIWGVIIEFGIPLIFWSAMEVREWLRLGCVG